MKLISLIGLFPVKVKIFNQVVQVDWMMVERKERSKGFNYF